MVTSLDAERALVVQVGAAGDFRVASVHNMDGDALGASAQVSTEILRSVRESGEPVILCDVNQEGEFADRLSLLLAGTQSAVCVPVKDPSGTVVALLYADRVTMKRPLRYSDMGHLIRHAQDMASRLFGRPRETHAPAAPGATPPPTAPPPKPRRRRPPREVPSERPAGKPLGRPSGQGVVIFFRSLAVMLAAGVALPRALDLQAKQSEDKVVAEASRRLTESVETGHRLSLAMSREPEVFSEFQKRLVAVGEATGGLHRSLERLADYEGKTLETIMRIRSALTYPAFLMAACSLGLVLAPPYVLGGHFKFLKESGVDPP